MVWWTLWIKLMLYQKWLLDIMIVIFQWWQSDRSWALVFLSKHSTKAPSTTSPKTTCLPGAWRTQTPSEVHLARAVNGGEETLCQKSQGANDASIIASNEGSLFWSPRIQTRNKGVLVHLRGFKLFQTAFLPIPTPINPLHAPHHPSGAPGLWWWRIESRWCRAPPRLGSCSWFVECCCVGIVVGSKCFWFQSALKVVGVY